VSVADSGAIALLEDSLGIINRVERDVAEALGPAAVTTHLVSKLNKKIIFEVPVNLRVRREANAGDLANLSKESANSVLVNVEGEVSNEESVGLGANVVTVPLSAVRSASLRSRVGRLSVGVVEVDLATLNLLALHGLVRLGAGLVVGKVDVAEALAAARVAVVDDTSAGQTLEVGEGSLEDFVIDGPGQRTREESSRSVGIGLGLLGDGLLGVLSLALLRGSLGLLLVRVGVGGVAVFIVLVVAVRRVVRRVLRAR
jgi:hypothetical protein